MSRHFRVALIGFGAIGQRLARGLLAHSSEVELVGILTRDLAQARAAAHGELDALQGCFTETLPELLARAPDMVVECAGQASVDEYAHTVLAAGCDLLLVSVGALCDAARLAALREAAQAQGRQIFLVAGAIGGTDWLQAASEAGLDDVVYRGRKPPSAWKGSPAELVADLNSLEAPLRFFSGTAREAARDYPRNANVAATIALTTLGMDRTRVELWADPALTDNCHEVEAWGVAGHLHLRLENEPDPDNPRTSLVTAYSALRTVLNRQAALSL